MVQIPKGLDPTETNGTSGETSKRGLYVFEPKDAFDNKVGDKKFLEANDPAQADAFVHMGWRAASKAEVEEYVKASDAAREEVRKSLQDDSTVIPNIMEDNREATAVAAADADKDSKKAVAGLTASEAVSKKASK